MTDNINKLIPKYSVWYCYW